MSSSISNLARFFDASPNPYLVLDRDLNIAAANAAYLVSVGRELSDIVGRWAWDAFPTDEETLKQAIDSFELVKRTRKPDTMALLRFDVPMAGDQAGRFEKRYWSITHTPVLDDAGEVEFILQHPIDVTALEILRQTVKTSGGVDLRPEHAGIFDRAEAVNCANQRLTDEAERNAAALAAIAAERDQLWRLSRDPFVVCDLDGRWISASPVWTEILGWRLDELIGRTSSWMEHPDDVSRTQQKVVDVADGEVMLSTFVNRFRGQDGRYRTFSWTAVSEGERLICVARDVTQETIRDEALRRYENIVESDTAPICAFDTEYRQIAFNRAHSDDFFRTYGHRVQMGEVFPDLLLPEQASMIRGFIDRALAGEMFTVTAEVGDPDLTVPHWELAYGPLRAADGSVTGAFHHAKDISERVRMQAELLQTQEVLRQAQKMESIGQLTGGIAHDFNNLLGGMSAALQVLQARLKLGKFEGIERYIGMAQDSIKRASALTQRLLAFARRQTLDSKPTDVNQLLSGLEDLIQRSVGPNVEVEVIGSGGLWTIKVDASQLENSVLNLCINSRDAMLPAGGRLTIQTANEWFDSRLAAERELPPGQYVSVSVTDTGCGMSHDVAQRIFDPFFTTKPLGQGTALGLSMVYGFVRQSGGQVRVYSELNKGTTMCLYLPRHQGEPDAELARDQSAFVGGGEGESIVLIEDEETLRIVVSEMLIEAGYSVATAEDGPSGLRILEKAEHVDCLITDVGLPGGLNGRQVADAARHSKPGLKVLFITGYAQNAAVGDGHMERGMEVITKPFDVGALIAKIRQMLHQ
ncbi:PAS domain-containing protein [Variovorax sp. RHLX14]|uniref:hybrid sensor histidine kinase/response regulator n=1 Tax=Variovorax sp. RHLX14 TaxID=1259731 RepID=UPI003F483545